jgi:hypothetical protein
MDREQETNPPPTTIWNQLDAWAQGFRPWQRFVLANAVRTGRLTDEQINQAYGLFLRDNNLADASEPAIEVPSAITGRPACADPVPIWLKRVGDLQGVNALPTTAELTFSPALTVIYGANGVGKTGFTRILSNICFSRTQPPILPNIYDDQPSVHPTANVLVVDGAQRETTIVFHDSTEYADLKRIAVFDSAVARTHLIEQSPVGFKPAGFDVFPEMARVYGQISSMLTAEIDRRTSPNTFSKSFIAPESSVSRFVATLSADTDVTELRRLAVFGDAERARLDEVQRQIAQVQSRSTSEAMKQLGDAKRHIASLQGRLAETRAFLDDESRARYARDVVIFAEKSCLLAQRGAQSFKEDFFRSIGTPDWERFLAAAHKVALAEHGSYPQAGDRCLLCHRPLDDAAESLIRRYWEFLASDARREVEEAGIQIANSVATLKAMNLTFFSSDTAAHAHLTRLNPTLAGLISAHVDAMAADRAAILAVLEGKTGDIAPREFLDVDSALTALIAQIDADLARLKEQKTEDLLHSLESERITLRHRQVLKQLLPEMEQHITDLAWASRRPARPVGA